MNLGYGNNPYGTYRYGDPDELVPVTGTGDSEGAYQATGSIKPSLDGTSSNILTVKGTGKLFPSGS